MHAVKLPVLPPSLVETMALRPMPVESARVSPSQTQAKTEMSSLNLGMAKVHASIVQATGTLDLLGSFEGNELISYRKTMTFLNRCLGSDDDFSRRIQDAISAVKSYQCLSLQISEDNSSPEVLRAESKTDQAVERLRRAALKIVGNHLSSKAVTPKAIELLRNLLVEITVVYKLLIDKVSLSWKWSWCGSYIL